MTDSPSVTCPSPARTTLPLRRMDRTVVERIRRFVDMSAILNYSSGRDKNLSPQRTQRHRENRRKLRQLRRRSSYIKWGRSRLSRTCVSVRRSGKASLMRVCRRRDKNLSPQRTQRHRENKRTLKNKNFGASSSSQSHKWEA